MKGLRGMLDGEVRSGLGREMLRVILGLVVWGGVVSWRGIRRVVTLGVGVMIWVIWELVGVEAGYWLGRRLGRRKQLLEGRGVYSMSLG